METRSKQLHLKTNISTVQGSWEIIIYFYNVSGLFAASADKIKSTDQTVLEAKLGIRKRNQ